MLPLIALSVTFAGISACLAETMVERGDVLAVTILEDQQLGREAKVNADGQIILPQLGAIDAAGNGIEAIRARIRAELIRRDIILEPTVLVDIAQYRSIYVGGMVARPGTIAFEPGLTVRHAVVLAGGFDRSGNSALLSTAEMDELKSELRASSYHLLQVESLIARLTAELERKPKPSLGGLDRGLVSSRDAESILSLNSSLLDNRIREWSDNQARLKDMITLADEEIDLLQQRSALQEQQRLIQMDELQTTRTLVEKGLVPLPRLQDMEREASRLSQDLLETDAFAADAMQTRAAARHDLAAADTLWRIETQRNLRAALLERTELQAETDILKDQLLAAGLSVSTDGTLVQPEEEVVIYRTSAGVTETVAAAMDTEIRPGDLIEISIARRPDG